jgi:hypothetical protein
MHLIVEARCTESVKKIALVIKRRIRRRKKRILKRLVFPGCCARVVSGNAVAAAPRSVMNSRRLIVVAPEAQRHPS